MLSLILFILTSGFLIFLLAAILLTIFRNKIVFKERVTEYLDEPALNQKESETGKKSILSKLNNLFKIYWDKGTQLLSEQVPKNEKKKLDLLLRDAGYPSKTAIDVRLIQILLSSGAILFVMFFIMPSSENVVAALLMAIVLVLLGFRLPVFYLEKKKTARIKELNRQMADFFDSVNLLLEAGLGLDLAMVQVARKMKGPISEEFLQTLDEMKFGKSRRDAFYDLRNRVASDSFQSIITALIQADQLGIGMAKVLSNLTVRIREQRKEAARELAMKAPVKMLFPMVFFIFPSIFIVILGPFVIHLVTKGLGG